MLQTTMHRIVALGVVVLASLGFAQGTPDIPPEKVIVVGGYDAGIGEPPPQPQPEPVVPVPDAPPTPETRTFDATPPPTPLPEQLDTNPAQIQPTGPGAMIDGHPREGAFLSGPGSAIFLTHHTLMVGFGSLATQLVPRAIHASAPHYVPGTPTVDNNGNPTPFNAGCDPASGTLPAPYSNGDYQPTPTSCSDIVTGEAARLSYLTSTLLGAGIGFTSAAIWQFNNWISVRSANFGIINSVFGGMFLGGFTDLVTKQNDAYATAWLTLIGSTAGAWVSAIVGGGDIALNKAALVVSGGAWAAIYAALIVGIVATTGGGITARDGIDAVMLLPALGAAAMAVASLKFNPSFGQVMRANLFGTVVGGAVLLLSGLLLGPATGFTRSPVPYILAGVGAIGAKTLISLLWADAAEANPGTGAMASDRKYRTVWW